MAADKELRIKIATEADAAGAQETTEALDATTAAAERAAEAAQDGEIISPAAAASAKEVAVAMAQTADSAAKAEASGDALAKTRVGESRSAQDAARATEQASSSLQRATGAAQATAQAATRSASALGEAGQAAQEVSAATAEAASGAEALASASHTAARAAQAAAGGVGATAGATGRLGRLAEMARKTFAGLATQVRSVAGAARGTMQAIGAQSAAATKGAGTAAAALDKLKRAGEGARGMLEGMLGPAAPIVRGLGLPGLLAGGVAVGWQTVSNAISAANERAAEHAEAVQQIYDRLKLARKKSTEENLADYKESTKTVEKLRRDLSKAVAEEGRYATSNPWGAFMASTDAAYQRGARTVDKVKQGAPASMLLTDVLAHGSYELLLRGIGKLREELKWNRKQSDELEILIEKEVGLNQSRAEVMRDSVTNDILGEGFGGAGKLQGHIEHIVAELRQMGLAAESPHEALVESEVLVGEQRARVAELAAEWQGYVTKIKEVTKALEEQEAAKRAATKAEEEAYQAAVSNISVTTEAERIAQMSGRLNEVVFRLQAMGVAAKEPLEAIKLLGQQTSESRQEAVALVLEWDKLAKEIKSANEEMDAAQAARAQQIQRLQAEMNAAREAGDTDREMELAQELARLKQEQARHRAELESVAKANQAAMREIAPKQIDQTSEAMIQAALAAKDASATQGAAMVAATQDAARSAQAIGEAINAGLGSVNVALAQQPDQINQSLTGTIGAVDALGKSVTGGFDAISVRLQTIQANVDQLTTRIAGVERSSRK